MNELQQKREAAAEKAERIAEGAKAAGRTLTSDEITQVRDLVKEIKSFDEQIAESLESATLLESIGNLVKGKEKEEQREGAAFVKSLGEHFVKYQGAFLKGRQGGRFDISAPEYKAPGDPHTVTEMGHQLLVTDVDRTVQRLFRQRLVVADWLGAGTISGNAITYFVEGSPAGIEGGFETVAETATKPGISFPAYTPVTESLKKIAGWIKLSDEMTQDLEFLVSEINERLLYTLRVFEEAQLLLGDGQGTNVLGLLNRTGVQTETSASVEDNFDAIFRAITKVATATGLDADGIVIHPLDYQRLRLSRDANEQYLAGGPFAGQYGQGGVLQDPPLWAKTTIVSAAIPQGTVLVGAGKQAATVYRKGGIQVDATNSDGEDFKDNITTIRAEERITLALRVPAAMVKVTLSSTPAPVGA